MNRALRREVNRVKKSAAFRPIVEDAAAARTLQALFFHAADVHRYAAIDEREMRNQVFNPPSTTGLVQPFYPGLGI